MDNRITHKTAEIKDELDDTNSKISYLSISDTSKGLSLIDDSVKGSEIIKLIDHPLFSNAAFKVCESEFKDIKKGFTLRNRAIPSWYVSEDKWISTNTVYYMPGLPICIKSAKSRPQCSLLFIPDKPDDELLNLKELNIQTNSAYVRYSSYLIYIVNIKDEDYTIIDLNQEELHEFDITLCPTLNERILSDIELEKISNMINHSNCDFNYLKWIKERINKINTDEIIASLPAEGNVMLFKSQYEAELYVKATRHGNIYWDLNCNQCPIIEVKIINTTNTSRLKEGTAFIEEEYCGHKHSESTNIIFIETSISNVIFKKFTLEVKSLHENIQSSCMIEDNILNTLLKPAAFNPNSHI